MSRLHSDDVYNQSLNTQIMRLWRNLETDPADPRHMCTERVSGYLFAVSVETIY